MPELRPIPRNSEDAAAARRMFLEAFPREERPPFFLLERAAGKPAVDFDGIYDGGLLVGLAYTVRNDEAAYLFFFAIRKESRGHGYGGQALELLKERYRGRTLFLALECMDANAENYAQRLNRHRFYEKHGLRDMPCRIREAFMTYDVMGVGAAPDPGVYKNLMDGSVGRFFRVLAGMRLTAK